MTTAVRPPDLDPAAVAPPPAAPRQRTRRAVRETATLVLGALGLALFTKALLLQAFYIPSASMDPTLRVGDRVVVEKVSFRLRDPQRGDLVVFRNPERPDRGRVAAGIRSLTEGLGVPGPPDEIDLVKRIVGLPGETVQVREGAVFVDEVALPEPYAVADSRDVAPVVVPDDAYWVLGDNRRNSLDSRFGLGTVPRGEIVGRAFLVLWPYSSLDADLTARYPSAPTGDD